MSDAPKAIFLKDYTPPSFLIPTIDLDFELGEDSTLCHAKTTFKVNPNASKTDSLVLDGEHMELVSIKVDGQDLPSSDYKVTDKNLTIKNPKEEFTLEITTKLLPQDNKSFSGLYKTKTVFCTQMEAEGFRRVTYFLDRPDVLSKYTTTMTADKTKYPILLSNGNFVEMKETGGGQHTAKWEDPFPKPCYLFALVAGDLDWVEDSYTTTSGKTVDLKVYVDKGKAGRAHHAMQSLKDSMKWDEDTFGLEYDLGIYNVVAVDDFNMGAMENKGLNIFNSKYVLADNESATDSEFQEILRVIGHEYFHNWSGNRVTCRDWFQLSLKEGLTVYRDQEFTCDLTSRPVKRIEDANLLRTRQYPEDAGPMAHPVRPPSYISIDNFYTATVYIKGAEVIRMMRNLIGEEMFKKGLAKYFELYDGQAVTTDDFAGAMESVSGKDLSQFKRWYDQAGTPSVTVTTKYDEGANSLTLKMAQKTIDPITKKENKPYHMPIKLGLLANSGTPLTFSVNEANGEEAMLELTEAEQTFTLGDVSEKPVVSLFREFTAPIKLNFEQSDDELYLLMTSDTDSFNRWESAQKVYLKTLINFYNLEKQGQAPTFPTDLLEAMEASVKNGQNDPALTARVLQKPSAHYVIQFLDDVDPQALKRAYDFFDKTVSEKLGTTLHTHYQDLTAKDLDQSKEGIAQRALKNTLLSYLYAHDDNKASEVAYSQFSTAKNMTDSIAALGKLTHLSTPESEQASQEFYDKWENDALVINKWLLVQAISKKPNNLEKVKALTKDPAFDPNNPNKLYALIFNFANENWTNFHSPDGESYRWFTDQVLDIDSRNPQVAARIVSVFNTWKKYSSEYQKPIKECLEKMRNSNTSENLFEIVDRALKSN